MIKNLKKNIIYRIMDKRRKYGYSLKNYELPISLTYEGEFSFLNLIKINKYFGLFETLDVIVELQSKGLILISKNLNDNFDFIKC